MCKRRSACRRSIISFFLRCGSLPLHSSTAQQQRHGSLEIWDPGMIRAWHDPCQNKIILEISEPGMECARKKACHVGYYHMVIWKFRAWGGGSFFAIWGRVCQTFHSTVYRNPSPWILLKCTARARYHFPCQILPLQRLHFAPGRAPGRGEKIISAADPWESLRNPLHDHGM